MMIDDRELMIDERHFTDFFYLLSPFFISY
jgi:hypothetical protein